MAKAKISEYLQSKGFYFSRIALLFFSFYATTLRLTYALMGYKVRVNFHEKIQKGENYIFVSNHKSMHDIPLLALTLPGTVSFIAKYELFSTHFLDILLSLPSTIPLNREKTGPSLFKLIKKAANSGLWSLVIFIEGTRSKTEYLGQPNSGVIKMAKLSKLNIVPVGLSYKSKKEVEINLGEPYSVLDSKDDKQTSYDCLAKISELSGYKLPELL